MPLPVTEFLLDFIATLYIIAALYIILLSLAVEENSLALPSLYLSVCRKQHK
jgi:flagellar biosynthesis component FlhA